MALSSISRFISSIWMDNHPKFTTSSYADKVFNQLQKNKGGNIEKTLASFSALRDRKCISKILEMCSPVQSQMGLRIFIWAGLQSNYRHNSYMYTKACKLFRIHQNPQLLSDVVDAYRAESCSVNVKTFKVVLNLYKEAKLADEALQVLKRMPEFGLHADTTMYNAVIRLFCQKGDMDMADSLMKEMISMGLYPNIITFVEMVRGFCYSCRLKDARKLLNVVKEQSCLPNAVLYSVVLDGVSKCGDMETALELLGGMEKEGGNCGPNVVTYTSLIQRFCEKGRLSDALKILDRMEAFGCAPNRVTVSSLIKSFCAEDRVEEIYQLIERLVKHGNVSHEECYSSLVVSLNANEKPQEAKMVFRKMLDCGMRPDGLACSIMIKDLCLEGQVLDGFHLCDEIESMGCLSSIDSDVYFLLLMGLCQQKHSLEALKLSRLMLKKGIRPKGPYIDSIDEIIKNLEAEELVNNLSMIRRMHLSLAAVN